MYKASAFRHASGVDFEEPPVKVCDMPVEVNLSMQQEDEASKLLFELLTADANAIPHILNFVLENQCWSLVQKDHIERVVTCIPKVGEPCLDFLLAAIKAIPQAVCVLRDPLFLNFMNTVLRDTSNEVLLRKMFELLTHVMTNPQESCRAIVESGCFESFFWRIETEKTFAYECAVALKSIATCSVPNQFAQTFMERVFELLKKTSFENPESLNVFGGVLLQIIVLLQKQCKLQLLFDGPTIVEVLTFMLTNPQREFLLETLNILANLCEGGDSLLPSMIDFGTICQVKLALNSNDSDILKAALSFFRNWCRTSSSSLWYLFDQISQVDFVHLCENTSFETKWLMVDLLLSMCDKGKPVYIIRLLSRDFIEALLQQMECFSHDLQDLAFQTLVHAALRCTDYPDFISMVRDALSATADDNPYFELLSH